MAKPSDRNGRPGRRTSAGRIGGYTTQVGADGVEPGVRVGGNLTVDASGDVGVQVAPGVSVQVTPETPAGSDGCTSGM